MAEEQALVPYDASITRTISTGKGEQRTSALVPTKKGRLRVRNNAEYGLEAKARDKALTRQLQQSVTVISEVYLKIGTHWSPIDGNAASEYGFGDID